jgi:hypothetical protein
MSTTGTSLRTIWIEIRAMNYAVNTLNDVLRQLTTLQKGQDLTAISCFNMAKAAMSAGILFSVLGSQVGGTAGQFLQYASYLMYGVAAMQALLGIMKLQNLAMLTQTITVRGLSIAYWELFLPVIAAVGVFIALQGYLGALPAALLGAAAGAAVLAAILWYAAGAVSVMSFGTAAIVGAAALAAAAGVAYSLSPHQMGTRMVGETGPAFLHKGEVVYNPSTGRPTQIGNDLAGSGSTTHIDASMHVDTLNTKMDTEELDRLTKKQARVIALNNR